VILDFGLVGRLKLSLQQLVDVNACKPLVREDISGSFDPQAVCWVLVEELADKVFCLWCYRNVVFRLWPFDLVLHYLFVNGGDV
jgi:hypothetical protein